jgi:hypothetical protein
MRRKSSARKKRRCWVVKWKWIGDHQRPAAQFCHVLPYRWSNDRVKGYMKALYANFEYPDRGSALARLNDRKFWNVRIKDDGELIYTGTNPSLEAHRVTDLIIEHDQKEMKETLRWTRPQSWKFVEDPTGSRWEPIGQPRQECYEHSHVVFSCLV